MATVTITLTDSVDEPDAYDVHFHADPAMSIQQPSTPAQRAAIAMLDLVTSMGDTELVNLSTVPRT